MTTSSFPTPGHAAAPNTQVNAGANDFSGPIALREPAESARIALACLDLTSLDDADTVSDVQRLCERAQSRFGPVAAVCVWPRFAALARRELPAGIAVAAVANFPDGSADVERAVDDTRRIVDAGAQEVDVVLPFSRLQLGDEAAVAQVLDAVRRACTGLRLKVILETGVLVDEATILRAAALALAAGADFLKTSTGKTPVSATPAAALTLLRAIAGHADPARPVGPSDPARPVGSSDPTRPVGPSEPARLVGPSEPARLVGLSEPARLVGLKASGGIRTVIDAAGYIALVESVLGAQALQPQRFRIGASGLLNDIEAVLAGRESPSRADRAGY